MGEQPTTTALEVPNAREAPRTIEDLLVSRKRKLSELFFVRHLDHLRSFTTEESVIPLKAELSSYLAENNVEAGNELNWDSLSKYITAPDEKMRGALPVPSETIQQQSLALPIQQEQQSQTKSTNATHHPSKSQQQQGPPSENTDNSSMAVPASSIQKISSTTTPTVPSAHAEDVVVIPEPPKKKRKIPGDYLTLYDSTSQEAIDATILVLKEYLPAKVAESTPLAELYYLAQTLPLVKLIPSTHKVVTSTMFESALTEGKINVVHSRIEELKRQGKWSLRQPTRFLDPIKDIAGRTHWENLLSEMDWMAIDFKEGRKLRLATCAFLAHCIEEYWKFGKVCCIRRKAVKHITDVDIATEDASNQIIEISDDKKSDSTEPEDNVPDPVLQKPLSSERNSIDLSKLLERPNHLKEYLPPTLPEVTQDEFEKYKKSQSPFKMAIDTNDLKAADKTLLDSIATFGSFLNFDDNYATAPLVPVSKVVIPCQDEYFYSVYIKNKIDEVSNVPDQQKGLFGFSSHKKISTSIKPPAPPSLKYLESRTPTIWLPQDDQDLIEYVNQFSFNWSAVSAHLSKRPTRSYVSNIERRTPWQCFERYIQLNDTFQINDMRGSNTAHAMKWLEHAHNIQASTKRRISPLGVGVDSIQRGHKRLRWASMFEAIRKCMRKRESVTRPNSVQTRKSDDKKISAPTPAELSKLKYERDKAMQDAYLQSTGVRFGDRANPNIADSRPISGNNQQPAPQTQAQVQAQTHAQTQAQVQQIRAAQGNLNANSAPPTTNIQRGVQQPRATGVTVPSSQQQLQANGPPKTSSSLPLTPNLQRTTIPITSTSQIGNQGSSQRPTNQRINGANGQPYTPEQLQQLVQMRQKRAIQQAQAISGHGAIQSASSSPNLSQTQLNPASRSNSLPVTQHPSPVISQTPLASTQVKLNNQNANNIVLPPGSNGNGGIRKANNVPSHVNAIINQIQAQHPDMPKNEVTKMAAQLLANIQVKQRAAQNGQNISSTSSTPINQASAVPTPQQLMQQQQLQMQQQLKQLGNGNISGSSSSITTPDLTPQQQQQLDMLKQMRAEQMQQRREQSAKSNNSLNGGDSLKGSDGK